MRQHRARLNAFKYTTVKAPGGRTKRVPIIKVSVSHKSPPEKFQVEGKRKKKRGFVPVMKEIFKKEAGPNENRGKSVGGWGYQYRAKLFHCDYQANGSQNAVNNMGKNLEREAARRGKPGGKRAHSCRSAEWPWPSPLLQQEKGWRNSTVYQAIASDHEIQG